jgi:phage replication O-like protein O
MDTIVDEVRGASPQAEDGHIDIANEIAEAMARINLSAYESRILWVVWRKTYGWHKKKDMISVTQFEKATGLKRRHIHRTLSELVKRKIVTRIGNSRIISYEFQKDYTKWKDVTKRGNDVGKSTVSGQGKKRIVTRIGNRSLPNRVTTKETIQKKLYSRSSKKTDADSRVVEFQKFWDELWLHEIGCGYMHSYGMEGKMIKELLKVHDLSGLQEKARTYFRDERSRQRGLDMRGFFYETNRRNSLKAIDPLEQARRELLEV